MAQYQVKYGDTLFDICLNTTGSLAAINAIMDANSFTTYTPDLTPGQMLEVPDVVYNSEAVSVASGRPFNNASIPAAELQSQFGEMEILIKYDGKITYIFHSRNILGADLYMNLANNVSGFIDWGDGKGYRNVDLFRDREFIHYTYETLMPEDFFVVTFIGTANNITLYGLTAEESYFMRNELFAVDISSALAVTPLKSFVGAFANCHALELVEGNMAGTDIKYANGMFHDTPLLNVSVSGFFKNCTSLVNINDCFNASGISAAPECFMGCTAITEAKSALYLCTKCVTFDRAFYGCTALVNCFQACGQSPFASVTDTFYGCHNIEEFSYTFAHSNYNFPVNYLDQFKKVKNFMRCFQACTTVNESPYTMVNGVKVHTWERNPSNGFAQPTLFDDCYLESKFTNWLSIPVAWGGGGVEGGSVTYGLLGDDLQNRLIVLNLFGNVVGRVDWGDGKGWQMVNGAARVEHTYTQNFPDEIHVTFAGLADNCNTSIQPGTDMQYFRQQLKRADMRQFVDCIRPRSEDGLIDISGAWRDCPNFTNLSQSFAGDTRLYAVNDLFGNCPNLRLPDGMFVACTNLRWALGVFQKCAKNATRDFYGCTNLLYATYCYDHATLSGASSVFRDCSALRGVSFVFASASGVIDTNVFDGCTSIIDFSSAMRNTNSANESPYTLVNGEKVHLWERNPSNGFAKPTIYDACFLGAKCADFDVIPAAWGGGGATPTAYIEVACRYFGLPITNYEAGVPVVAWVNGSPITAEFTAYLDGLNRNIWWIKGNMPTNVDMGQVRFVFMTSDKTEAQGGTMQLSYYSGAPVDNLTYSTYANGALLFDSKYHPSLNFILDPLASYDRLIMVDMPFDLDGFVLTTPDGVRHTIPNLISHDAFKEYTNIHSSDWLSPVLAPENDILNQVGSAAALSGIPVDDIFNSTIEGTISCVPTGDTFTIPPTKLQADGGGYIVIAKHNG